MHAHYSENCDEFSTHVREKSMFSHEPSRFVTLCCVCKVTFKVGIFVIIAKNHDCMDIVIMLLENVYNHQPSPIIDDISLATQAVRATSLPPPFVNTFMVQ